MKKIRVMTADNGNLEISKKLTPKQWQVYYYLMAICKWNGMDRENHYYIYKDNLNVAAAAKLLGISRTTFYNGIDSLQKQLIISKYENYYTISIPKIYADVNQKTLLFLIQYQKILGVDLIRTYTILNRISSIQNNFIFTKRKLLKIMGYSLKDPELYKRIELYLGFFHYWGLIELKFETKHLKEFGKYKEYQILKVNSVPKIDDFLDFCGEEKAPCGSIEELEKIKEKLVEEKFFD